ncbi:MAG: aminoacyl-tRNA hydrolase [Desulfobacteraceae bacterium 4572_88]|nr:MAG: aminoacyl-tRNA hydrolase [Desulfobacteraceae bacterium 4572_88]
MIRITDTISISKGEIREEFIRSSGPGGQNVNKVSTAVQLRFDVENSPSLPDDVRERLIHMTGKRVNDEGVLIIKAARFRSQERNRQDAIERLSELIRKAAEKPRVRRKGRPSSASKERRLENKRQRSRVKNTRQPVSGRDD